VLVGIAKAFDVVIGIASSKAIDIQHIYPQQTTPGHLTDLNIQE